VNPFIHYRLGQSLLQQQNEEAGIGHLLEAYMLDGEDIFLAEADGAAYLKQSAEHDLI